MEDLRDDFDWRAAIRARRLEGGLSLPEVARRSGLSLSTVKAYERGDRRPSRRGLDAIIEALGLGHDEANPVRAAAGFAIDWRGVLDRRYLVHLDTFTREAAETPWPVFITNQGSYVVYWNRAFEVVWDVDVEREFPDRRTRSLLAGASIARFTRCIVNYGEAMSFFLGLFKGDPRRRQDLERPAPWNRDQVRRLFEGDPGELRRLLDAWEQAEPIPHRMRHQYRIVWRHRGVGPDLRFIGQLTVCDIWNELNWQEWVPADSETAARLEALLRQPRRAGG